jgi:WD40 repeat protein
MSLSYLFVSLLPSSVPNDEKGAKLVRCFQHPDAVSSVLFWPKKELLVTGCWDGSIRFWDIHTGKVDHGWKAHQQGVTALALGRKGTLASGGCDQTVRIWDGLESARTGEFKTREVTNSISFSPDGVLLCSAAWHWVNLWDSDGLILESHDYSPSAVAFSPTGNLLAIGTKNRKILLVEHPYTSLPGQRRYRRSPREGLEIAVRTEALPVRTEGRGVVIDLRKRTESGAWTDEFAIYALAFSPDGRTLASIGELSDLILFETLTAKERRRLKTDKAVAYSVALAPNGHIVATGEGWGFWLKGYPSGEQTTSTSAKTENECDCTRLWDIRTGKPICRLARHEKGTRCVAFSPDGNLLATGSEDKTALLWDVSAIMRASEQKAAERPLGDLQPLWLALTNDNAVKAFDAILAMSESSKQTVPFLRTKLRPIAAVEKATIEKIFKDLDGDDFSARDRASQELSNLGEGAEPVLREKLSKEIAVEARDRIEKLIEKCKGHNPPPEILGAVRGIEVLERIGSDDAVAILESLAKGIPSARQTQEAKDSLKRLRERKK